MENRLINVAQIAAMIGCHERTVWRWVANQKSSFPKPLRMSGGITRWHSDEIIAWLKNCRR